MSANGATTSSMLTNALPAIFDVQLLVVSYSPDDGSPVRTRLQQCAAAIIDIAADDDAVAACKTWLARPHILIDLVAFTTGGRPRLPALRPAPLIISYLGYPGTAGGAYTDYSMVDIHVAKVCI